MEHGRHVVSGVSWCLLIRLNLGMGCFIHPPCMSSLWPFDPFMHGLHLFLHFQCNHLLILFCGLSVLCMFLCLSWQVKTLGGSAWFFYTEPGCRRQYNKKKCDLLRGLSVLGENAHIFPQQTSALCGWPWESKFMLTCIEHIQREMYSDNGKFECWTFKYCLNVYMCWALF